MRCLRCCVPSLSGLSYCGDLTIFPQWRLDVALVSVRGLASAWYHDRSFHVFTCFDDRLMAARFVFYFLLLEFVIAIVNIHVGAEALIIISVTSTQGPIRDLNTSPYIAVLTSLIQLFSSRGYCVDLFSQLWASAPIGTINFFFLLNVALALVLLRSCRSRLGHGRV